MELKRGNIISRSHIFPSYDPEEFPGFSLSFFWKQRQILWAYWYYWYTNLHSFPPAERFFWFLTAWILTNGERYCLEIHSLDVELVFGKMASQYFLIGVLCFTINMFDQESFRDIATIRFAELIYCILTKLFLLQISFLLENRNGTTSVKQCWNDAVSIVDSSRKGDSCEELKFFNRKLC